MKWLKLSALSWSDQLINQLEELKTSSSYLSKPLFLNRIKIINKLQEEAKKGLFNDLETISPIQAAIKVLKDALNTKSEPKQNVIDRDSKHPDIRFKPEHRLLSRWQLQVIGNLQDLLDLPQAEHHQDFINAIYNIISNFKYGTIEPPLIMEPLSRKPAYSKTPQKTYSKSLEYQFTPEQMVQELLKNFGVQIPPKKPWQREEPKSWYTSPFPDKNEIEYKKTTEISFDNWSYEIIAKLNEYSNKFDKDIDNQIKKLIKYCELDFSKDNGYARVIFKRKATPDDFVNFLFNKFELEIPIQNYLKRQERNQPMEVTTVDKTTPGLDF
jgi:hypothetical protein